MNKTKPSMSADIFDYFEPYNGKVEERFTYDFIGVKTSVEYHKNWAGSGGALRPGKPVTSWEWIPLLYSVITAKKQLTLMELGAGWGPWISRGYVAAKLHGIENVKVIGVEGEPTHFEFLKAQMDDNDITEENRELYHAIVSPKSGVALFPNAIDPQTAWGLRQIGREGTDVDKILEEVGATPVPDLDNQYMLPKRPGQFSMQQSISLNDLLKPHEVVDFIHFDIQGSEGDVIDVAIKSMNKKCRIIAVGTHSEEIEIDLRKLLSKQDWTLVHDDKRAQRADGRYTDGNQVWMNNRF